jgi:hypothetical protein
MNWLLAIGAFYGLWALWMLYEIGRADHEEDENNDEDDDTTKR